MLYLLALIPSFICIILNIKYLVEFVKRVNTSNGKPLRASLISNLIIQTVGITGLIFHIFFPTSDLGTILLLYSNASVNLILFLMFVFYMDLLSSMVILQTWIKHPHIKIIKIIGFLIMGPNVLFSYIFVTILVSQTDVSSTLWTVNLLLVNEL